MHVLLRRRRPLFLICVLVAGLAMYQFKKANRVLYGIFALGFGVACGEKAIYGWHETVYLADRIADWVALGAGV